MSWGYLTLACAAPNFHREREEERAKRASTFANRVGWGNLVLGRSAHAVSLIDGEGEEVSWYAGGRVATNERVD